nr:immunoglobulin light chain junction region [Mus musculus]NSL97045.1 immunoglobulin light chain junction region [Mus musculus]NSL97195.1 immunoglobulin light chain junction region [Mus musculus]NSL97223.1 immunoglobulin light chain junction region [Mus musculus]NSL97296.1 immunoglobulin light chain junction region [Mus musculus]
CQQSKEVPWTF